MKKIFFLLFLGACASCGNPATQKIAEPEGLPCIKIEKPDFSKLKPLLMSGLVDSIRYIQLETSPRCFLSPEGGRLTRSGNLIFTAYRDKLYQFGINGDFIRQIGREGKGPGEFALLASRYSLDEANNKVFVVSKYSDVPLVFGFDGTYLGGVRDSTLVSCWEIINRFEAGDGYFLFAPYLGNSETQVVCRPYELIVYDYEKNGITQSLTNRMVCKTDRAHHDLRMGLQLLKKQGDRHFYKSFYNDTLYAIGKGRIDAHAVIDLGERKYPADLLYSHDPIKPRPGRAGKLLIYDIFSHPRYLLFSCILLNSDDGGSDNDDFICRYDVETGVVSYHSPYITNDLDGGANMFVDSFAKGTMAVPFPDEDMQNKKVFFSDMDNSDLKYPDLNDKFRQIQQRRDENDNPLLMTWQVK